MRPLSFVLSAFFSSQAPTRGRFNCFRHHTTCTISRSNRPRPLPKKLNFPHVRTSNTINVSAYYQKITQQASQPCDRAPRTCLTFGMYVRTLKRQKRTINHVLRRTTAACVNTHAQHVVQTRTAHPQQETRIGPGDFQLDGCERVGAGGVCGVTGLAGSGQQSFKPHWSALPD